MIVETDDYNSYIPFVPILEEAKLCVRHFSLKYNAYLPEDVTPKSLVIDHEAMLQQIIGRLGKNSYVEPPFFIDHRCDISIGSDFYANFKSVKPFLLSKQ